MKLPAVDFTSPRFVRNLALGSRSSKQIEEYPKPETLNLFFFHAVQGSGFSLGVMASKQQGLLNNNRTNNKNDTNYTLLWGVPAFLDPRDRRRL